MSEIFQSIGSFLSGTAGQGLLKGGAVGGGFLQNWLANRESQKKQQFVENLVTDPKKWSSYVQGFDKPLTQGLTTDIARQTDAYGAERGLGSSPAIMKDVYAQALAPYIQQEQQMGQNAALQSLGIYENSPTTKPVDITSLLKLFMNKPGGPSPVYPGMSPTQIGGGQVPIQSSPIPDQIPETSNPGAFDYSSLMDSFAGGVS